MTKIRSARTVIKGDPIQKEAAVETGQTVQAGQLIERIAAGTVQPHSTANGTQAKLFARERDVFGKDRSEVVAADEQAMFICARSGDEIQALLADGENVVIGAVLSSDGAGALQAVAGTAPNRVVGFALEALNNTSGTPSDIIIEAA